jgi:hypothetical protein
LSLPLADFRTAVYIWSAIFGFGRPKRVLPYVILNQG